MSEQKESSVLFNLKELMSLEEERIQSERAEAQRRRDEEAQQKAEAEARKLAEENARRKAEEDARLDAERRERDEAEQRQRQREAAELRVRLETEAQLRAKEQERQLQHELHLKQLETQRRTGIPPLAVAAIALLSLGGLAYGYFGVYKPEQARAEAEKAEKVRIAQSEALERQRLADALAAKERETERLADEKRRMEEQARLKAEQLARIKATAAATPPADDGNRTVREPRHGAAKPPKPGKPADGTHKGDDDPLKGLDDL